MMNIETNNTNITTRTNDSSDSSIVAKIRRLKIQEGLILQHINKFTSKLQTSDENNISSTGSSSKLFISKLHNSYREIKNVFDAVKNYTSSPETLENCDIDDVKKDVIELDIRIKKFKAFLGSNLMSLKSNEHHLTKEINEITDDTEKMRKHSKGDAKMYADIVPSPVRTVISSPFKYPEVQQFQEFMTKSRNRYGGWPEYNHNIFVQCWRKHFPCQDDISPEQDAMYVMDSLFVEDSLEKISGITRQELIKHIEWYSKYLHYKTRQQKALKKWRAKRQIIKKIQKCNDQPQREKINFENKVRGCRRRLNNDIQRRRDKRCQNVVSDGIGGIENTFLNYSVEDASDLLLQQINDIDIKEAENSYNLRTSKTSENVSCKPKIDEHVFHYAKSTEQWNNKCQSKKQHDQNTFMRLEDVEKL